MSLPIFQNLGQGINQLQTVWAQLLNPVLANNIANATLLTNITLDTGVNTINHGLGTLQQGWFLTDITEPVTVYRSGPFNNLTLQLTSSGVTTISLAVY